MTDIPCGDCGRPMQIRTASTGVFLGCSGYALPPKERCKNTINLTPGDEAIREDADDEAESRLLRTKHRCKLCNTAMDSYLIDEARKLHVCGNNPDCPGFEVEQGRFKIRGYDGPTLECDKCGAEMQLKSGRFGKYDTYVLRDGAAGLFLAASQFPRNRETRAPLVAELLPHRDEIDPKYSFLFSAPTEDPEGNPAQVRYSRKTAEQYVMSEKDGKATGWKAWRTRGPSPLRRRLRILYFASKLAPTWVAHLPATSATLGRVEAAFSEVPGIRRPGIGDERVLA